MINEKDIKPIPKYIIKLIKNKDKGCYGFVRYYSYFTKIKNELSLITVACRNFDKQWFCKQVAVHGIHSEKCLVKDVEYTMLGYNVGWYKEGISKNHKPYDDNKWWEAEDKYYNIQSYVLNKKFPLKLKEYKYSLIDKYRFYDAFKYLKIYEKYPQAEYLMKLDLQQFATKVSILKKIGKDKQFRKWIIENKKILSNERGQYPYFSINTIFHAYNKKISLLDSFENDKKVKELLDNYQYKRIENIIPKKEIEEFIKYLDKQNTNISSYCDYIDACTFLGLDLKEIKYPKDFQFWHDTRINEKLSKEAKLDEEKRKQLYESFKDVAEKYSLLQRNLKENYVVIIPSSPNDLIKEGKQLNHCVGRMGYDKKFANEESLIFFVRAKNNIKKPLVTVEYSLKNHKVLQCYGNHDSKPSDEILNYVNKIWLPYANRKIKKVAV